MGMQNSWTPGKYPCYYCYKNNDNDINDGNNEDDYNDDNDINCNTNIINQAQHSMQSKPILSNIWLINTPCVDECGKCS